MNLTSRVIVWSLICSCGLVAQQPVPVIFDTDIGSDIDDALALALALQSPELDIRAITTVSDDTEKRTRLVWKELGYFGRRNIPVGTGAREPLLDPMMLDQAPQFRVLTERDVLPEASRHEGVALIIATLMNSPGKITLVPVGPLTNIALALKTQPRIKEKIERIVLMGGAFFPSRAEWNIKRDRIAAEIVFESGLPITAVGLDVTQQCTLTGEDLKRLRSVDNDATRFLVRLIELWQDGKTTHYPTLHDPLAVGAAIRPLLLEKERGTVKVDIVNPQTYGMTAFTQAEASATTEVARHVNARAFLTLFMDRVAAPPRSPAR
ncbi:MAG: Inosine/uridine-preferring nucleoside hydrolase [Bryobacterales bacterium]|nr:Inosine/uridine-preferring nucleoside hydrolase [Bryobacterales bacterium]